MASYSSTGSAEEMLPVLARCEERIGYIFADKSLLRCALTHASGADHRLVSNERLEFLGDAILGAVICENLYKRFPEFLEGDLTRVKSMVVSRQTCAKISGDLKLEEFLILGKGIASSASIPQSLLSDVLESIVAAIYLDGGSVVVREFIERLLEPEIDLAISGGSGGNYKSLLQQRIQRQHGSTPIYEVLEEKGPDHSKHFKVAAEVHGEQYPPAWGRNKKEAEQRAACNALRVIEGEEIPYSGELEEEEE